MAATQSSSRLPSRRRKQKDNTIRVVDETPRKFTASICPTNLVQQKERFLRYGILPQFVLRASVSQLEVLSNKPLGKVSTQYLQQALKILQLVKAKYISGDEYFEHAFGPKIDIKTASSCLTQYLNCSGLDGHMNIVFSSDLDCSARMMWHGPHVKQNRPEARKHTLIIKNSPDNFYLREQGIICLANHEIGTHYLRSLNDGLQPWYADRKMFGLRSTRGYHFRKTEEGLAALNTILQAKSKFLYGSALVYYIACMAETMTFKELFQHLEEYVQDPERRWHYVMRVKRHLPDPNDLGGLGKDQCYFEGAMEILQDIDNLELPLIYSGTLCTDETSRVRRLARLDCLKLPQFMDDLESYRHQLRWIGYINGILPKPSPRRFKKGKSLGKLQQGIAYGRDNPNKNQKSKQNSPVYHLERAPSNMVLINERNSAQSRQDDNDVEHASSPIDAKTTTSLPVSATKHQITNDYGCILEKISSRLTFHDDLIKRVETRLSCASLSLKQSEKIMFNGLEGKSGLATELPAALPTTARTTASPVPVIPSKTGKHSVERDEGSFSVQSRPPTQHETNEAKTDSELLTYRVEKEIRDRRPQITKRPSEKPLLLRRNLTNL
ncbi:microtubule-associated tyrosine carboxypeptidase 1-like [Watersipora subatra]|uniref:microtubule-associated tyrosine carboxypeptidase 1-like n=1 Tax=Watersipora subatra TaxID=2589382 RepID=UPI00355AF347